MFPPRKTTSLLADWAALALFLGSSMALAILGERSAKIGGIMVPTLGGVYLAARILPLINMVSRPEIREELGLTLIGGRVIAWSALMPRILFFSLHPLAGSMVLGIIWSAAEMAALAPMRRVVLGGLLFPVFSLAVLAMAAALTVRLYQVQLTPGGSGVAGVSAQAINWAAILGYSGLLGNWLFFEKVVGFFEPLLVALFFLGAGASGVLLFLHASIIQFSLSDLDGCRILHESLRIRASQGQLGDPQEVEMLKWLDQEQHRLEREHNVLH